MTYAIEYVKSKYKHILKKISIIRFVRTTDNLSYGHMSYGHIL